MLSDRQVRHRFPQALAVSGVPGFGRPEFAAEAHRQSAAIAASEMEAEDQAYIDAISWEWDEPERSE